MELTLKLIFGHAVKRDIGKCVEGSLTWLRGIELLDFVRLSANCSLQSVTSTFVTFVAELHICLIKVDKQNLKVYAG